MTTVADIVKEFDMAATDAVPETLAFAPLGQEKGSHRKRCTLCDGKGCDECDDGYEKVTLASLVKYAPDQERDDRGRWSTGPNGEDYTGKGEHLARERNPEKIAQQQAALASLEHGLPALQRAVSKAEQRLEHLGHTPDQLEAYMRSNGGHAPSGKVDEALRSYQYARDALDGAKHRMESLSTDIHERTRPYFKDEIAPGAKVELHDGRVGTIDMATGKDSGRVRLSDGGTLQIYRDDLKPSTKTVDAHNAQGWKQWLNDSSKVTLADILKYSADQSRDDHGRWDSGGGGTAVVDRHERQHAAISTPTHLDTHMRMQHPALFGRGVKTHEEASKLHEAAHPDGLKSTVYDYLAKNYPEHTLGWVKDAKWELNKSVPLKDIDMARRPGGARDPQRIKDIMDFMHKGGELKPIVLVKQSNGRYAIADGYHRTQLYKEAGRSAMPAYVGTGLPDKGPWSKQMHEEKLNKSLEAELEKYSDDQERDGHGRWTSSGNVHDDDHARLRSYGDLGQHMWTHHQTTSLVQSRDIGALVARHNFSHGYRPDRHDHAGLRRLTKATLGEIVKYSDDQPRDAYGRFSTNGAAEAAIAKLPKEVHVAMVDGKLRLDAMRVSMPNSPVREKIRAMMEGVTPTRARLDPKTLIATQPLVYRGGVEKSIRGLAGENTRPGYYVDVARYQGKDYVADGHHRAEASLALAFKSLPVRLYDLDSAHKTTVADIVKYSPDQERDDHGRWSSGGGGGNGFDKSPEYSHGMNGVPAEAAKAIHDAHTLLHSMGLQEPPKPNPSPEALEHAKALIADARAVEKVVTEELHTVVSTVDNGSHLVGLDARVKSEGSLGRKIDTMAGELGKSPAQTSHEIGDVLRYTTLLEPNFYAQGVTRIRQDLADKGYKEVKMSNYWPGGNRNDPAYRGINMQVLSPQGQRFELQFHTHGSFVAKEGNHPLYELQRTITPQDPRFSVLTKRMAEPWARAKVPPGVETIR